MRDSKELIRDDLAERRAFAIRVFGSVAGTMNSNGSDIDLVVDVGDSAGLVCLAEVARELCDLLDVLVDVVPADSLNLKRETRATN